MGWVPAVALQGTVFPDCTLSACHGGCGVWCLQSYTWGGQRTTGQAEWGMPKARCISTPQSNCPVRTDLVIWMLCLLAMRGSLMPVRRSSGLLRLRWMCAGTLPSKGLAMPLSPPAPHTDVTCRRPGHTQCCFSSTAGPMAWCRAGCGAEGCCAC